jgi:hypothetical protein
MKLVQETVDEQLRQKHMRGDRKCAANAINRSQLTFTLVEQDRSAPKTITYWIMENIETAPSAKLIDALETALVMRAYANRKNAD